MKDPIDTVQGRIIDYDPVRQEITIKAKYKDWVTLVHREYKECLIQLLDGRPISDKQRKTCYALLRDISNHTGQGLSSAKEGLKGKFMCEELGLTEGESFSLSDASVSLVCAFQKYLVRFMLDYDIPSSMPLLEFVDDVHDYLYACLNAKKCCICGKPTDLHHVDHVGAGRDRVDMVHEGLKVQPLCRIHHTEVHQIGQITFDKKHHLCGGIALDKHLCKLYNLKTKESNNNAE